MTSRIRSMILSVAILAALVGFGLTTEHYLSPLNLSNLIRHATEVGLLALAMTAIMISGGIDLSVGSTLALSAVTLGWIWESTGRMGLACAGALTAATAAGLLNGVAIAHLRIPPLLVTLATMSAYRGLALGISKAKPVHNYPISFLELGDGMIAGIPIQAFILLPVAILAWLTMTKRPQGKHIYLIGSGEDLAIHTGVLIQRRKMMLYVWSGLMAGVAALLFVARVSTAKADFGQGLELNAIAAVVLGGTSISGGSGTVSGTLLGLTLIKLLEKGMELNRVASEWRIIAVGALLILSAMAERIFQWIASRIASR